LTHFFPVCICVEIFTWFVLVAYLVFIVFRLGISLLIAYFVFLSNNLILNTINVFSILLFCLCQWNIISFLTIFFWNQSHSYSIHWQYLYPHQEHSNFDSKSECTCSQFSICQTWLLAVQFGWLFTELLALFISNFYVFLMGSSFIVGFLGCNLYFSLNLVSKPLGYRLFIVLLWNYWNRQIHNVSFLILELCW